MDIFESAREFLRVENDEFDSEPNCVNISTVDYDDYAEFEVKGQFPNESTPDEYVFPPTKRVLVDGSSELFDEISALFREVRENVRVRDATIRSISFSKTSNVDEVLGEWSFYTSKTADARIFISVSREKAPVDVKNELIGLLLEELHKLDDSVSADDVRNVEYLFDDMKRNFNHCLRGELWTEYPHRYYSDVSSVKEYATKLADDANEQAELVAQDEYKSSFFESMFVDSEKIDNGQNTVPPMYIREQAEAIMEEFVSETLDTSYETMLEAESISFGEFDDHTGYGHEMNYWLYVPITDGELGVSQ